jgi:beta-N-acetylhexosaminidase
MKTLVVFVMLVSSLCALSLEEKVGQLFMIPYLPLAGKEHREKIKKVMQQCHIENVIVMQSSRKEQTKALVFLQSFCKGKLFVAQDAEWGMGMRLYDALSFPKNFTLGAVQKKDLFLSLGRMIGEQCRRDGVDINLAPVVDLTSFLSAIQERSFGNRPQDVIKRAKWLIEGMHQSSLKVCIKHFPGHGAFRQDSHNTLPSIDLSKEKMQKHLLPFQELLNRVDAIMVGHLLAYDAWPASLSCFWIETLREWGFRGVVITDSLSMKALEKFSFPGFLAHRAGCDLLLYADHRLEKVRRLLKEDIVRDYHRIVEAYKKGELDEKDLDRCLQRVLVLKKHVLQKAHCIEQEEMSSLKRELYRNAITVIRGSLPYTKITYLYKEHKEDLLRKHFPRAFPLQKAFSLDSPVVIGLFQKEDKGYGLSAESIRLINTLAKDRRVILCLFGSPYVARLFPFVQTILVAYETDVFAQEAMIDILEGKDLPQGKLPLKNF